MKRAESGQAVVLLAIAFVVLLGFVGLVTDVSLLFVRYSRLHEAVDAAAVSAAGEMRRVADVNQPGDAAAVNAAQMNLAARQMMQLYDISPSEVVVETCGFRLSPASGGQITGPDPELCTPDQRKRARVTAQMDSPTVFLRLLGFNNVRLTASAVSEAAALDMVLILDVSESMLDETSYSDWENIPEPDGTALHQGVRYVPPYLNYQNPADAALWQRLLGLTQFQINQLIASGQNPALQIHTYAPPGQSQPRDECRVRFSPTAVDRAVPDPIRADYAANHFDDVTRFGGFVPTMDFYGCCNDPNGDGDFSDLVCQPFKQARDASLGFLDRLDFVRGDRVAFVTFDRRAYVVDPDGVAVQAPEALPQGGPLSPMIDNEGTAARVLNQVIGVRAEPSFYADTNNDGRWDALMSGGQPRDYRYHGNNGYFNTTPIEDIVDDPVYWNCPFNDAALGQPFTPNAKPLLADPGMTQLPDWWKPPDTGFTYLLHSYEYWASCRGTNIGAALAQADNTLTQLGRRDGAVQVMVLLSDGAAGASDPVTRNGHPQPAADPYARDSHGNPAPAPGAYGGFGVCPYGTPDNPGQLLTSLNFPHCSDAQPQTRHFCGVDASQIDLAAGPDCETLYDVDDYARDWADYVAGVRPALTSQSGQLRAPTIYTIGFGLPNSNCQHNVGQCLGESLLRYVADAGDNARIDDDYQQSLLGDRIANPPPPPFGSGNDWGLRGPCEDPNGAPGVYAPLPPGQSCGNYFHVQGRFQLDDVFNQIISHVYTRIVR